MNPKIEAFLAVLSTAVKILQNPVLGLKDAGRISILLEYGGSLLRDAAVGQEELEDLDALIRRIADENRAPTDAEWAEWESRLSAVDDRFARLREREGL